MRLFPVSLFLLLAWGALAVGGSPSWAGVSVAVLAVTTGLLGFLERPRSHSSAFRHWRITVALSLCLAAVGVQLIPLSTSVVNRLSPKRGVAEFERLLASADRRDPELVPAVPADAHRPLSIAPSRTWWGLAFVTGFSLLLVGASVGFSSSDVTAVAMLAALLGALVALLGMYQVAGGTPVLYGLYHPVSSAELSAPFINKNHQAGWLVMVLALTLGAFAGEVARGMRGVAPRWRDRVIWFSSKQANVAILLLFAALVMAIGILLTRSRSGALALLMALIGLALWGVRRQPTGGRRRVMSLAVIVVALIALLTSGAGVLARFATTDWSTTDARVVVWRNSLQALNDFWVTGTGFNTYGTAMLHYQAVYPNMRFIEAHNDYLQFAIEGGLLVGIPALLLVATLATEVHRRFREAGDDTRTYWLRVGAVTGIVAMAFQSVVEFTLQMPGAAVMFATLLAVAVHHPRPRPDMSARHVD